MLRIMTVFAAPMLIFGLAACEERNTRSARERAAVESQRPDAPARGAAGQEQARIEEQRRAQPGSGIPEGIMRPRGPEGTEPMPPEAVTPRRPDEQARLGQSDQSLNELKNRLRSDVESVRTNVQQLTNVISVQRQQADPACHAIVDTIQQGVGSLEQSVEKLRTNLEERQPEELPTM